MYQIRNLDKFIIFIAIFYSLINIVLSLKLHGYLSAPFFYDRSDSFMDFFHVQYWTYDTERYAIWKSIYTPFSFFLAGLFPYEDYGGSPYDLREDGYINLIIFYFFITILITFFQVKTTDKNKILHLLLFLSSPYLFTLDRGNLLVFALFFLLIANVYYNKTWVYIIFMAMAISLKIYLVALLFIPTLNFQIAKVFLTLFMVYIINELSANIIGANDWQLFIDNIFNFSSSVRHYEWSYFTYSYQNILLAFTELNPKYKDIGAWFNILTILTTFIFFLFVSTKYLLSSLSFRDEERNTLFLLLAMLIMIVVKNSGGYVFILLFPFLSSIIFNRVSLYILLLLLLPIEIPLMTLDTITMESFISGQQVEISRDVTSGMILRPLLFLILYYMISMNFLLKKKSMFKDKFFTLDNNFVRFILVGILNTIIGYGLFVLFIYLGLHYSLAVLFSTILGVLFNFKSIGRLVFNTNNNERIYHFVVVYTFLYLLNVSGLWGLSSFGIENMYVAGAILLAPLAILSFFLNRNFVFNKEVNFEKN